MKKTLLLFIISSFGFCSFAQNEVPHFSGTYEDSMLFSNLKYRLVGPFRGGRSGAVAGDFKRKNVFYFGGTGGGVWKTIDGGSNWKNISDIPQQGGSTRWETRFARTARHRDTQSRCHKEVGSDTRRGFRSTPHLPLAAGSHSNR